MQPATFYSVSKRRDARHGSALVPFYLYQGAPIIWRVGVLTDAGAVDSLSNINSVKLRITSYGGTEPGTVAWLDKEVEAADFLVPSSPSAITSGAEWNVEFVISADETLWPIEDIGTRRYWYEIRADDIILSSGQLVMRGTGGDDGSNFASAGDFVSLSNDVEDISEGLSDETAARIAADASLSSSLSTSVTAEAATRASADSALSAANAAEAATRLAADAAFALANSGTNSGDQKGDASTVTQGIGGAFSAVVPLPAASGSIVLNQAGEYEQAPGFSGVVENWQDLDPLDPSSLITVGMLPALLTRLGITIPTP